MNAKRCIHCNVVYSFSGFHRDSGAKDGLSASCARCRREYWHRYHQGPGSLEDIEVVKAEAAAFEAVRQQNAAFVADAARRLQASRDEIGALPVPATRRKKTSKPRVLRRPRY